MSNDTAVALLKALVATRQFRAAFELATTGLAAVAEFWLSPQRWPRNPRDHTEEKASNPRRPMASPAVLAEQSAGAARQIVRAWAKFVERSKAGGPAPAGVSARYAVVAARHARDELLGLAGQMVRGADETVDGLRRLTATLVTDGEMLERPEALDSKALVLFELVGRAHQEASLGWKPVDGFEPITSAANVFFDGLIRYFNQLREQARA
jgi:hypothetical protein